MKEQKPADEVLEAGELELDVEGSEPADFDALTREALAAVERVEGGGGEDSEADAAPDVAGLEREIVDLRDRAMRTLADFDNFRKRADREREDIRRYATTELLRDLVGVADNLDLALASSGSADDLKKGVELTQRQFLDLLRRHGVREVAAVGERFDPARHEAVSTQPDPAATTATVIEELRRGYTLHDRLLRPAMVRVALPSGGGDPD